MRFPWSINSQSLQIMFSRLTSRALRQTAGWRQNPCRQPRGDQLPPPRRHRQPHQGERLQCHSDSGTSYWYVTSPQNWYNWDVTSKTLQSSWQCWQILTLLYSRRHLQYCLHVPPGECQTLSVFVSLQHCSARLCLCLTAALLVTYHL